MKSLNLIVNADDLGICEHRNVGIINLLINHKIQSASLLVNFPSTQHAV